jgi:hypothetical protein
MTMMKNRKTTAAGAAAMLTAIAAALISYSYGDPINWTSVFGGIYMFWLGLVAKDDNVTGGTIPQTEEAIVRVEVPEVIKELGEPLRAPLPPHRAME